MWNNCRMAFSSLSELVGHVNLLHLRISSPMLAEPAYSPSRNKRDLEDLSCQWGNCHDYPAAHAIPGSSSSPSIDAALGVLADHLLQDHLGLRAGLSPVQYPTPATVTHSHSASPTLPTLVRDNGNDIESDESSEPSQCKWRDCGACFIGIDDLTAHISTVHVGAGRAHYECFWDGCNRSGEKGFGSKQKICRHIQSHTGHRPFQCKLCKQYFSEAATLQQHTRRHTQEKPYLCDFPGCGKAFAIAGALTIHKRTHNGLKPFKCTYCERAFSESSNLSKHLRTHTGVRPYNCPDAGCSKAFSRPDQLTRHMGVHKKRTPC
ncbi:hypothetical protein FA95DRAFT_1580930 [Auriscalpium vulgare]|uniref:Uncharacterized protein n=1 Tax=Auriscalpium vulgare TaxID=40419 RepID=A0ACB8S4K0_9AGAM|nr:hypothetical protein FA95DRAFT_1580930 [Auriscalpium vulgare]